MSTKGKVIGHHRSKSLPGHSCGYKPVREKFNQPLLLAALKVWETKQGYVQIPFGTYDGPRGIPGGDNT